MSGRRAAGALAAVAVLASAVVAGRSGVARAGAVGASPEVWVARGIGGYAAASLAHLTPTQSGSTPNAEAVAAAVNLSSTEAVFAVNTLNFFASAKDPLAYVVPVAGGAPVVVSLTDVAALSAVAADPTNADRMYLLGSNGAVDVLDLAGVAHEAEQIPAPQVPGLPALTATSLAVTPDGGSLVIAGYFNEQSWGVVQEPVAGGVSGFYLSPPTNGLPAGVTVVLVPSGGAAYATADLAGADVGVANPVVDLPLPLGPNTTPDWSASAGAVTQPQAITVSPDGQQLYVVGVTGGAAVPGVGDLQQLDAATGAAGPSTTLSALTPNANNQGGPAGVTVAPDGATVVVAGNQGTGDALVVPVAAGSLTPGTPGDLGPGAVPAGQPVAVTPDQAPVAALAPAAGTAGQDVTLNASGSSVAYGSITGYQWTFGDGTTAHTSGPTVAHVYADPGTYSVSVTETDSAGNSLPPAPFAPTPVNGPGTTPYLVAGQQARAQAQVLVGAAGHAPPSIPSVTEPPSTTGPPGVAPVLVLDPPVGSPGTIVTVSGHGFRANQAVAVTWSTGGVPLTENTDGAGNLPPEPLAILVPDLLGPRFAVATSAATPTVQQPFLVVPATAEPGSGGSPLFRSEGP
jgi:hypothetical protein